MSSKHYFPTTAVNTLVPHYLSALTTANPSLVHHPTHRILLNPSHPTSQISLISGGGSGHEPAWTGYVGDGLLAAVACGDIFASPSMKQVLAAIASVPSDKGVILLITNYTGDRLHFGLAAERAVSAGLVEGGRCVVLAATDDVSIGRSRCGRVGRRGLAGNVITMKVLGAAAARDYSFERCVEIGTAVNDQLVSIGSALDHCHVPGRQNHEEIGDDIVVIGAGIHNEPGAQKVSPFPSVENLISQLLTLICDPNDPERAFVKFAKNDDTVLLMNNYGGLSNLELGALTHETLLQLETTYSVHPTKIYSDTFETSLNGPGFSITLCNLTTAATASKTTVPELLDLLAAPTSAPAWPNVLANTSTKVPRPAVPEIDLETRAEIAENEDIKVNPNLLSATITLACHRAIAAEPDLTNWDMQTGDGDCGEAVKGVCTAILSLLSHPSTTASGSIFHILYAVIDAVDDMGGTLGAIFGILLAALATALRAEKIKSNTNTNTNTNLTAKTKEGGLINLVAPSLTQAVTSLKTHTGARVGDRTVMDVLIPFQETLDRSRDLGKAVGEAEKAAEGTRSLKARFGRASYVNVGGEGAAGVPDPGAWALMEIVRGVYDAVEKGEGSHSEG